MIKKINELKQALEEDFTIVEINTDSVLKKENTAVIYVEELNVGFETYHRKEIEQGTTIIFNIKTDSESALDKVDLKLDSIVDKIITIFDEVLRVSIKLQYVASRNLMFVQLKFFAK